MTLTLQTIRDHKFCLDGWKTLTKSIGNNLKTELSIGDVLISNNLNDALWCLRCLEPRQRVAAVMPAVKRASVHTTDSRVHNCIADIDKWLAGDDTVDLKAAEEAAAEAGAWAVAWAKAAPREATREAAWAAAWATRAATRAATWTAEAAGAAEAARAAWATRAAARAAERKLQEADLLAVFPPMILKVTQ